MGWSTKGEASVGIFMLDAVAIVMRRGKTEGELQDTRRVR